MNRMLSAVICLVVCLVFSHMGISGEGIKYPLNIRVQLSSDTTINPMLIWEAKDDVAFKELAGLTVFVFNTDTKMGQTMFLISNMNKGKVAEEDHTIDLGKFEPGEYEVWIEAMMKKKKYSNKVIFTIE